MIIAKIGGGADLNLAGIVRGLARLDEPLIIVHGANAARDALAAALGREVRRLTSASGYTSVYSDDDAIDLLLMAYAGLRNKRLVELCQTHGLDAVGLTGLDGGLVRARRNRGVRVFEDGRRRLVHDLSGKPVAVNTRLLELLLGAGHTPVVTVPLRDEQGRAVNSENDEIVRLLQQATGARLVLQFMEAPGLLRDPADPASVVTELDAAACARWEQEFGGRIRRKLRALHKLLSAGPVRVLIGDGRTDDPVGDLLAGHGTTAQGTAA